MDERRRSAYLEAIGVPQFLPRVDLPGARPSARRLRVVTREVPEVKAVRDTVEQRPEHIAATGSPLAELRDILPAGDPATASRSQPPPAASAPTEASGEQHNLLLIRTGTVCWLEALPDAGESGQARLILALARALGLGDVPASKEVLRWPPAGNGTIAAGTAEEFISSRLSRELADGGHMTLVAMGGSRRWCQQVDGFTVLETVGATQMLAEPSCKQQVWWDLSGRIAP